MSSTRFTFPINDTWIEVQATAYGYVSGDTTVITSIEWDGSQSKTTIGKIAKDDFPSTTTIDGKVYRWTIKRYYSGDLMSEGRTYVEYAVLNIGTKLIINKPFFEILYGKDTKSPYTASFYDLGYYNMWFWDSGASDIELDGKQEVKVSLDASEDGNRLSLDAVYRFKWSIGSRRYTKDVRARSTTSGISASYTPPKEWNDQITSSTEGRLRLSFDVVLGTQVYKTYGDAITCTVPDDCVPTINRIALKDSLLRVPTSWGMFVQYQSNVAIASIDKTLSYGAEISRVTLEFNGKKYSGSIYSLPETSTITEAGVFDVTVTITDTRGREAEKSAKVTVVEYETPKISEQVYRCTKDGEQDNDGTYFAAETNTSISSCNGKNSAKITISYKLTSSGSYGDAKDASVGNKKTVCAGSLDTEFSYDVQIIFSDTFNTIRIIDYIPTATYLMHFLHGGRGVAFGQKATIENAADFAFDAIFRGGVAFEKSNGEQVTIAQIIEKLGL